MGDVSTPVPYTGTSPTFSNTAPTISNSLPREEVAPIGEGPPNAGGDPLPDGDDDTDEVPREVLERLHSLASVVEQCIDGKITLAQALDYIVF